ncbi:MAG: HAD-IA family hydrolase [Planctomycetota bacterium]|nr:HAD-IA family hydrolase [Planctomycetota bacterium]MEC8653772.1 HAD-IA family hydrolase [Planctomycetota bacterium]MEC9048949.1 HAD-IA family hydrolase [Planctomycetota bacterium]
MTKPLDAVFFDIDDTLFSTTVFADKARRNAVDAMIRAGLRVDRADAMRELEEVIAEFSSNYGSHFDKVLDRLGADAYQGHNRAVIVAAGVVAYHGTKEDDLKVYDDVYATLKWLSEKPVVRGIISAGITIKQAEKLVRLDVLEFLTPSAIFITDQVGFSKPNPKLYKRALEPFGAEPSRCIYVGDNPTHDIDPCNELGWNTVRIRRSGRHAQASGRTAADHEVRDFLEFRRLLETEYSL